MSSITIYRIGSEVTVNNQVMTIAEASIGRKGVVCYKVVWWSDKNTRKSEWVPECEVSSVDGRDVQQIGFRP